VVCSLPLEAPLTSPRPARRRGFDHGVAMRSEQKNGASSSEPSLMMEVVFEEMRLGSLTMSSLLVLLFFFPRLSALEPIFASLFWHVRGSLLPGKT